MRVSVICVYNDRCSLDSQLLSSLQVQGVDYELILLDNSIENADTVYPHFSSAASALNEGVHRAKGDILIFTHQDITLKTTDSLRQFAECINSLPVGSIVGTQGVRDGSRRYYTNLTAGEMLDISLVDDYPLKPIEVSCVDEGFFGMRRETWEQHPFDEVLCDNWHLYCVESCLYHRSHGGGVYVYPIQLHHYSMGTISLGYMQNLRRLCQVYRKDFKYIWTTCYKVRTNPVYINLLVFLWTMNRRLRGTLK